MSHGERIWMRRDRETGREEEVTEDFAKDKVSGRYIDFELALKTACKEAPLTTNFADYWRKEVD